MAMCEKCWSRAFLMSLASPWKEQADYYQALIDEQRESGVTCTPKEQAGPYWDEEKQCDSRVRK